MLYPRDILPFCPSWIRDAESGRIDGSTVCDVWLYRPPERELHRTGREKDPNHDQSWEKYRARKAEAQQHTPTPGAEPKGKGKGKGKTKGKNKGKQDSSSNTQNTARSLNALAGRTPKKFPEGAAGLDSWANVYLQYVDRLPGTSTESLQLADGTYVDCESTVGKKGIPTAFLRKAKGGENIDLLPQEWLVDRWCEVRSGSTNTLTTPQGAQLVLHHWEGLPYLDRDQITTLFNHLPPPHVLGRKGYATGTKISSSAITFRPRAKAARVQLPHVSPDDPTHSAASAAADERGEGDLGVDGSLTTSEDRARRKTERKRLQEILRQQGIPAEHRPKMIENIYACPKCTIVLTIAVLRCTVLTLSTLQTGPL